MRKAFISTLCDLAAKDPRVLLITADLGWSVVEPFAQRFPDRFINVGVAEANAIGIATGLAHEGFRPYVYSIASFWSRAFESILRGPVAHHLEVRIVGVGGGLEYGLNGPSHWALEDVGLMRTLPRMAVIVPGDARQASAAIQQTADYPGPVYYRLGKDDSTLLPGADSFDLGWPNPLITGGVGNLLLLCMGPIAAAAIQAAKILEESLDCDVALISTLAPGPHGALVTLMRARKLVVAVETHYPNGGLGSLAAELIAECGLGVQLLRCAVPHPPTVIGSQAYLEALMGLDGPGIAAKVRRALKP